VRPWSALILLLSLFLGACGQVDRCMVSANPDTATCSAAYMPPTTREPSLEYTSNPASPPAQAEVIDIRLDHNFSGGDRAKILRAVEQWNHVLNGFVRMEVAPLDGAAATTPTEAGRNTWIVARADGRGLGGGMALRGNPFTHALAQTQPLGSVGGMVLVYADRIGSRDLTGVMMHEFGHVLGLGHDSHGRLMASHYSGNRQACIDLSAAQAVAAQRNLPLDELNWCGGDPLPPNFARVRAPAQPQAPAVATPVVPAVDPTPADVAEQPEPVAELAETPAAEMGVFEGDRDF
jgi:hypothetical protein